MQYIHTYISLYIHIVVWTIINLSLLFLKIKHLFFGRSSQQFLQGKNIHSKKDSISNGLDHNRLLRYILISEETILAIYNIFSAIFFQFCASFTRLKNIQTLEKRISFGRNGDSLKKQTCAKLINRNRVIVY